MRDRIRQRTLFFAGCEGDSELAYVALLNKLAPTKELHIAIRGELLNPGSGDPLELVRRGVQRIQQRRRRGTRYRHLAIFLDFEPGAQSPQRMTEARTLAARNQIQLIWQHPNHEAVLLRHLDGCQHRRPDADHSFEQLKKEWPEYEKSGISAEKLGRRIGLPQIVEAARFESDLRAFLVKIGMI